MGRTIKTRSVVKNIKTATKRAGIEKDIKTIGAKTKEAAEEQAVPVSKDRSDRGYAESEAEQAVLGGVQLAARHASSRVSGIADKRYEARRLAKKAAKKSTQESTQKTKEAAGNAARQNAKSVKTAPVSSVKTSAKKPKTASASAKTAVKTTQSAAKAPKTNEAAKKLASRRTATSFQSAVKASKTTGRKAIQGLRRFAHMAIAAAKSLGVALAAGGGAAVAVILVICLVGLITTSAFGIFFMGDDMGDGNPTLREVVAEIDGEHTQKIEEIKAANPHDEISLVGSKTAWKEALAVFAVKATTDSDNPLDVVTLDATRQQFLRDVFWTMNSIEHRVEEREVTEVVLEEDEESEQVEAHKTAKVKTLVVTLSAKPVADIAKIYGFTQKQSDLLYELLDKKNDSMWQSVLYGIRSGSGDIVEIALSQVGNAGGQPYWSWYGYSGRVEWCACFVSWCANETGYIESGAVPKFSYCPTGVDWFKSAGLWKGHGFVPQPGDIIFFDWGGDGVSDHVGIVESCDGNRVYTIEGNSGDACQRNSYSINSSSVMGYGTPIL